MIRRFHVLYVGQIELDNIGLDGTPANDRLYSDERLREAFFTARDVAQVMDETGYDVLWTAEHHFQREGYEVFPNLIQLGLWLATQTKRLKLGCAFNVLPMWHPIRLAEDYAMADIVTDGRIVMGVGRGYHTREVESFGAPLLDADKNRALFEEQVELMLKCFNEQRFRHKGQFYEAPPPVPYRGYTVKDITMVPRPKHRPVDIYMPVASGKTIDLMAKYGFKAMVTLNGEKILDDVLKAYQAAYAKKGVEKKLGEDVIWGAGLYLAGSQAEAIEKLEPAHDERFKWFAPFGFVRYADEHGRTWGMPGAPAGVPKLAEGVRQKAWFCGTPKDVIDGIKSIEAKYPGLEDFMIHWAEGLPPAVFKEQLRWFAKDVMPAFKGEQPMADIKILNPDTLGKPLGQYSQITRVKASEFLFIAGQVGADKDGKVEAGFDAQCSRTFANLGAALASQGATFANVVEFTTYLVHSQDIPKFMEWRLREFPKLFPTGAYPPNTLLIIDRLVKEELLIEVSAVAAL